MLLAVALAVQLAAWGSTARGGGSGARGQGKQVRRRSAGAQGGMRMGMRPGAWGKTWHRYTAQDVARRWGSVGRGCGESAGVAEEGVFFDGLGQMWVRIDWVYMT